MCSSPKKQSQEDAVGFRGHFIKDMNVTVTLSSGLSCEADLRSRAGTSVSSARHPEGKI